jgi:cyanophycinase
MGGGPIPDSVSSRFLELAGGKKARLVVVPTASEKADSPMPPTFLFWKEKGVASVALLHTRDRKVADDPGFAAILREATGVWVTGGDQSKLTEAYLGTNFLEELKKVFDRGGVIGGTSAGASVMSSMMITGGTTKALTGNGFGFVPGVIIDQHFTKRNRIGRLSGLVAEHTDKIGLGLDESTAVLFQGDTLSIVGDANAYLCTAPTKGKGAPTVQRLKAGDKKDLFALQTTIHPYSETAKVQPAVPEMIKPTPVPILDKILR